MPDAGLEQQVAERFREVNGDHPMSEADDAYVSAQFITLERLCAVHGRDADAVRRLMLEQRLPLPGYLRSDGAEMVPADLFALADEAGGVHLLEAWFTAQWADPGTGNSEWNAYLSGQYVCLHSVTPAAIQRKEHLTTAIGVSEDDPDAGSAQWVERLHAMVDDLDALEPDFTAYDRLRFGGPTSRDICIDAVRARFPRPCPGQVGGVLRAGCDPSCRTGFGKLDEVAALTARYRCWADSNGPLPAAAGRPRLLPVATPTGRHSVADRILRGTSA